MGNSRGKSTLGSPPPAAAAAAAAAALLDTHKQHVQSISAQVKDLYTRKQPFRISHGSTNSTRPRPGAGVATVSTASLSNVLQIDPARRTALVEPNVPMDRLVEATLPHGLIPPVVMEFPGITVGGGYAGTSGESSSFKHGFFDRTINQVEMVLGNGDVVTASETERPDLFRGAAGAVGSLGVATCVELQLMEARRWVEVVYHPVGSVKEGVERCSEIAASDKYDYVDGILFSKNEGAIVTGRLTDEDGGLTPQTFSGAGDPWFYLHVQDSIRASKDGECRFIVPLAEYLFRYDRGGFWVGRNAFQYFKTPFNRVTRWFLDDFLHTRMMYTALHASGMSRRYVVQDLAIPYGTVENFIDYTIEKFGIFPLWLCPLKQSPSPTMHPHSSQPDEPMLNVGLWGMGSKDYEYFVSQNRDLESKLRELGGMKWLYAHTYESKDDFWERFDKGWYDSLRDKYHATTLPSVYEKVKIDVDAQRGKAASATGNRILDMWPLSGFYGIAKAIRSKSYRVARASSWKGVKSA